MAPAILALIGSPYQALGLLEYVREQRITKGTVFLPIQDDLAMLRPTMNVLMHLRGFTFHSRRSTGFRQPGVNTETVAEELVAIGREKHTVDTVVIGDYRDTSAWRVASLLGRTGPDVVVLDDGAATLAIDRSRGGFAPLEWSEEAERGGFMPQKAVTFFTSMPDSLQAAPGDTVVPNNWSWLEVALPRPPPIGLARARHRPGLFPRSGSWTSSPSSSSHIDSWTRRASCTPEATSCTWPTGPSPSAS